MKHILYKFLLLFVCIILTGQVSFSKDIRFIQVTDIHYKNDSFSVERLDEIIKGVNSTPRVDFVAFTGDHIDQANQDTLKMFLKQIRQIKYPYYIVLGNHDVFKSAGLSKEQHIKLVKKYSKYQKNSKTNFTFEDKGVLFVVLDGSKEAIPGPGGYYRPETLQWLDKVLTKNKHKKIVMLQHFPLKQRFTERDAYKITEYQELLKRHNNVIATFSGHFHANEEYSENGVFHCITGKAFGKDAGYKIVDMLEEKNPETKKLEYKFYTQMVFLYED